MRVADVSRNAIIAFFQRYDLAVEWIADGLPITGSFWGEPEAGIVGRRVFLRGDTPVHSMLHEACHIICMTEDRRERLYRDAGGDDLEEAAVCYLQIVVADCIAGVGSQRLMQDMDAWGYSFRLGCTRRWFEDDSQDAVRWLQDSGLLSMDAKPVSRLRDR